MTPGVDEISFADLPGRFLSQIGKLHAAARWLNWYSFWWCRPDGTREHFFTRGEASESACQGTEVLLEGRLHIIQVAEELERGIGRVESLPQGGLSAIRPWMAPIDAKGGLHLSYAQRGREGPVWSRLSLLWSRPHHVAFPIWFGHPMTDPTGVLFEGGTDLVQHYARMPHWSMQLAWDPCVVIDVDDRRGRLVHPRFDDSLSGELRVTVEAPPGRPLSVTYVARALPEGRAARGQFAHVEGTDEWRVRASPEWAQLSVALADGAGEILDSLPRLDLVSMRLHQTPSVDEPTITSWVEKGEHDTQDLKSWTVFSEDRRGRDSLLKEVVAFSNGPGGRVLIGVTDDGEPDGPEVDAEAGLLDLTDELIEAQARVEHWIREHIEPSPEVGLRLSIWRRHAVLIVTVRESGRRPHSTQSGQFYVRSGSHARAARHADIIALVEGRDRVGPQRS